MNIYYECPLGTGLLHSGWYFKDWSICLQNSWSLWGVAFYCVDMPCFIYPFLSERYLGYLHFLLWIRLLWTWLSKYLCGMLDYPLGILRNSIAGSWGKTIPSFLRNHQIAFQNGCTSLHSHHQWKNVFQGYMCAVCPLRF